MSELNATIPPPAIPPPAGFRSELGHLAVRVDGLRPPEIPFLFERKPERMGRALASSVGVHALFALAVLLVALYGPKPQTAGPITPERLNKDIVWLSVPGPGSGVWPGTWPASFATVTTTRFWPSLCQRWWICG